MTETYRSADLAEMQEAAGIDPATAANRVQMLIAGNIILPTERPGRGRARRYAAEEAMLAAIALDLPGQAIGRYAAAAAIDCLRRHWARVILDQSGDLPAGWGAYGDHPDQLTAGDGISPPEALTYASQGARIALVICRDAADLSVTARLVVDPATVPADLPAAGAIVDAVPPGVAHMHIIPLVMLSAMVSWIAARERRSREIEQPSPS